VVSARRWPVFVVGFLVGAGVWHAVGFWSFMEKLVHGVETQPPTFVERLARMLGPEDWAAIQSRFDTDGAAARRVRHASFVLGGCTAVVRPKRGLEARRGACVGVDELRHVRGLSPKQARGVPSRPLVATFKPRPPKAAPVAGWSARVDDAQ